MKARKFFYTALASLWICLSAGADEAGVESLVMPGNLTSSPVWDRQGSANTDQYLNYFLVSGTQSYSGDRLDFGWRRYKLSRNGAESTGRYFFWDDLLLLWNWQAGTYDLLNVESLGEGAWKSCWGQSAESARTCDANSELVYIFDSEAAAIEFDNPGATDDELAQGPEPTEPEPDPVPTEPEPDPEPTEPEPDPEPTEPEPDPEPTEPEPDPEPTEPEPDPEPTEPEPDPEPTEPEPEPEPTEPEPEPEPEPTEPEPSQPVDIASVQCSAPPEELKAALLQATNDSRSQARRCGSDSFAAAGELVWNAALAAAARKHSNDMATNNFFSHTGSDGLQVWDRANAEGYEYRYIGENIAAGQETVGVVQNGWINSPGHCRNIMAPQIVEMGAACVVSPGSDYTRYWTVVVGQPR